MTDNSTVLGFDCSAHSCSAALIRGGDLVAHRRHAAARGQAEILMPMIEGVLADARLSWPDVELFGVTVGPGSFTGLRIGLSVARALALAGRKGLGVATTEAVARSVPSGEIGNRTLLSVIDGKRDDLFVQAFDHDLTPLSEIEALLPGAIAARYPGNLLLAGDGAARAHACCPGAGISAAEGGAEAVARLALLKYKAGGALPLVPLYLRAPDVTVCAR